jgi:hypothetical protein
MLALVAAGCGKEIGDPCIVSSDCSQLGDRQCDPPTSGEKDGYCTIQGCDYNTCPQEAACIRFFTGSFSNKMCDPTTEDQPNNGSNKGTNDCSLDELCELKKQCVPRSSEVRYCMKTCKSDSDCRDGYECRDLTLMEEHGGEPVLAPSTRIDQNAPHFCATKPAQ